MSITFREFVDLAEGKKNKNAVRGTYKIDPETGDTSYTLKPTNPNKTGPLTKKEVLERLKDQGNIGRKSVELGIEKREKELKKLKKKSKVTESKVILGKGETYGSKGYQERLEKQRQKQRQKQKEEAAQRREQLYRERVHGDGMVSYEKDESGVVRRGRRKDGKFTPDADT